MKVLESTTNLNDEKYLAKVVFGWECCDDNGVFK